MNKGRLVEVYEWQKVGTGPHYHKVLIGEGSFQQYGCDYDEHDIGPGNFSTAIVEMPDGTVKNLSLELIVFK